MLLLLRQLKVNMKFLVSLPEYDFDSMFNFQFNRRRLDDMDD